MGTVWKAVKMSDKEYRVLEYSVGGNPDLPYVLAVCSGPGPASDIVIAMNTLQDLRRSRDQFEASVRTSQMVLGKGYEEMIRKYQVEFLDEVKHSDLVEEIIQGKSIGISMGCKTT